LVELIVVIVVLGVLAVIAAPRFISVSTDAQIAALKGMEAALKSGSRLVYSKSLIAGQTGETGTVTTFDIDIPVEYGYPSATLGAMGVAVNLDISFISSLSITCADEWCGLGNWTSLPSGVDVPSTARVLKLIPEGYSYRDQCGVYYINYRSDQLAPLVGTETDEC
jgi:type II secretory pathway pseudopilin PulG